jgi:hypothetical protein
MSSTREPTPSCSLCYSALRLRLGQLECPRCGLIYEVQGSADESQKVGLAEAGEAAAAAEGLDYYAPSHNLDYAGDGAVNPLYFEKRLCFKILVWLHVILVLGIVLSVISKISITRLFALRPAVLHAAGSALFVGLVFGIGPIVLEAAIGLPLLYWALFGANALPKWGCLVANGLSMLYMCYLIFLILVTGRLFDVPLEASLGPARGLVIFGAILITAYQVWIFFIFQRELFQR